MNSYYYYLLFVFNWNTNGRTLRIIGGRDALRDEFPYAVALEIMKVVNLDKGTNADFTRVCSGAALNSEWILSAAHCYEIHNYLDSNTKLVARYNSYFPKYLGDVSLILDVHIHPRYVKLELKRGHDVALFRSQKILSVSQYAKISSVEFKTLVGHEVNILGFGVTNASYTDKPLQVLKGMLNKCLEEDDGEATFMCVVPSCGLAATICGGDSGGPVVHPSGIIGVNSNSIDNCDEFTISLKITPGTSASIVAMVGDITDWLVNTISKNVHTTVSIK